MSYLIKDERINDLLAKLRSRFGKDSFEVVDHWDADLCAIGVTNQRALAYVSTFGLPADQYYLELELLTDPDEGTKFELKERYRPMGVEQLLLIIAKHLGLKEKAVGS